MIYDRHSWFYHMDKEPTLLVSIFYWSHDEGRTKYIAFNVDFDSQGSVTNIEAF